MKPALFVVAAIAIASAVSAASAQDPAAGQKVFNQCRACHKVGEGAGNGVGPHLNGLFGRQAGTVEGYNYSAANKNSGILWDEQNFREYIAAPRAFMPGTKMAFAGIKDGQRITDLIAYLKQFDASGAQVEPQP